MKNNKEKIGREQQREDQAIQAHQHQQELNGVENKEQERKTLKENKRTHQNKTKKSVDTMNKHCGKQAKRSSNGKQTSRTKNNKLGLS